MSGKEILVDTNIILYLLNGSDTLVDILHGKDIYISFFTELELIGYKHNTLLKDRQINNIIAECSIIALNNNIKEKYAEIRKKYNLKLVDAIIAATAIEFNLPLISADKGFKSINKLQLISYQHSLT